MRKPPYFNDYFPRVFREIQELQERLMPKSLRAFSDLNDSLSGGPTRRMLAELQNLVPKMAGVPLAVDPNLWQPFESLGMGRQFQKLAGLSTETKMLREMTRMYDNLNPLKIAELTRFQKSLKLPGLSVAGVLGADPEWIRERSIAVDELSEFAAEHGELQDLSQHVAAVGSELARAATLRTERERLTAVLEPFRGFLRRFLTEGWTPSEARAHFVAIVLAVAGAALTIRIAHSQDARAAEDSRAAAARDTDQQRQIDAVSERQDESERANKEVHEQLTSRGTIRLVCGLNKHVRLHDRRSGASEVAAAAKPGDLVLLLQEHGRWVRLEVQTESGPKAGWARKTAVTRLGPCWFPGASDDL